MASRLSGVSRSTFSFLLRNIAGLLRLSSVPVGLAIITVMILQAGVQVTSGPIDSLSTIFYGLAKVLRSGVVSIVALIVILLLWVMFFIQIQEFRLTGKAPSVWGSRATWRTTFKFSALCILVVLLAPVLVLLLHLLARGLAWNLGPQGPNEGANWTMAVNPLIVWLLAGTVLCRLAVGFPPLAIGEPSGPLVGWRLSKGHTVALSGRALVPASCAFLAFFIALFPEILGIILSMVWSVFSFFFETGFAVGSDDVARTSADSFHARTHGVSLYTVFMTALLGVLAVSTVFAWYVNALFAEIYLRLRGSGRSVVSDTSE